MNFQKIAPVERNKSILDIAFRKAREKGKQKNLKGNWLQIIRQKEALKLDVVKDSITNSLSRILEDFPNTTTLPQFYIKLFQLTLDYPQFKKSLGAVNWAKERTKQFHREYVSKIVKEKDRAKIKELSAQCYGRISSLLKQIDSNLQYLEESRKIMRTYPDIKDLFTVCIYGFPNVGKTTLLNKITGTKAKVAAYPFTTKGINAGYASFNEKKVQFLDVPGTLAREDKMNLIELQADLVVKELANMLIYVFDISGFSGYSVTKQEELYKKISAQKKVLIYLSKQDILEKEQLAKFRHKHHSVEELSAIISEQTD